MRQAIPPRNLDADWLREIADFIPRGSAVVLLERNDDLAHILATEKGCILAKGAATATVVVALGDAELSSPAFAEHARQAALAVVLTAQSQPDFDSSEWRIIDRRPLSALRSKVRESPLLRRLAFAASCWPYYPLAPKRWLSYRLQRVLASAERLERLARLTSSARIILPIDPRQILLLRRST